MVSTAQLAPKELEDPLSYLPCSTIVEFGKGQSIYHQTEPGAHLFLIISGNVKVSRLDDGGTQIMMDIYRPEEFFGESALLGPISRAEQATALVKTRVMTWADSTVEEVMLKKPGLGIALLQIVASRAEDWKRRIEGFANANIPERLTRALFRFAVRLGEKQSDGSVVLMPLSHETLAQYVGTSREIVTHYMAEFRRAGRLEYTRKRITLASSFERLVVAAR